MRTAMGVMGATLALLLGAGIVVRCHDACVVRDTRCHGATVQECDADGAWYAVVDCAAVGGAAFECCDPGWVDTDGAEVAGCCLDTDADGGR